MAAAVMDTNRGSARRREAPLLVQLVRCAADAYDPLVARRAGGRARFDHLACRTQALREAPAGLGNAGAGALRDMDDIHWPSVTHPGAIIWAALDAVGADGEALWRGGHMGYEVTARLGSALGSEHRRHWHATATAGTVGAAVAAATAIGADPVAAAAHAVSVMGGSILCILEYSGTRVMHRDHAAEAGVRCARLAELSGPRDGLEHPRGVFAAMGGSAERLTEPWPLTALEQVSFRRHLTSGFNQAAVEAAQQLAGRTEPMAIKLEVPAATAELAAIPDPKNAEEAWWSCQHAVAATLLGRDPASPARDPEISRVRRRVRLGAGSTTTLTVDGRVVQRDRAAELSDEDLVSKWRRLNPDTDPPLELLV